MTSIFGEINNIEQGAPLRGHRCPLAAAAVVVILAAIPAAVAVAAVAEDQQQDDDPPPVVAAAEAPTDTVVIAAHNRYLRFIFCKLSAYTPCYDRGRFL